MFHNIHYLQKELAGLIDRHTDGEGYRPTSIPCLGFSRYSAAHHSTLAGPPYRLYNPSIGIVVQGLKSIIFGEESFTYGPSSYLVTSMDLPVILETVDASPEVPNLSCKIEFTPGLILELLGSDGLNPGHRSTPKLSMYVAKLDESMLDAVVRLVRLLDKPADIAVLAPLYQKEILYRILCSENGGALRQIVTDAGPTIHIRNAIEHILQHFQDPIRVDNLAELANMSVPSFHRHFKEMTAMSPIQFQKQLRLQEARRLIMSASTDVSDAAFQVGYESLTQFSREYSRRFGLPPREDMKRLKGRE
jgi:AraC-like DNA-binding protein